MKTILPISILAFLLVAAVASPCLAYMPIEEVSPERAKELGMEIRSKPAGPDGVRIELEFKTAGELKRFSRVDMEIREGERWVSASLREERPGPGRVVVSFAAARADLDKITLRVVTGAPLNMAGHDLRVEDFVETDGDNG